MRTLILTVVLLSLIPFSLYASARSNSGGLAERVTELEEQMEAYVASGELDDIRPTAAEVGKAYRIDDALGRYIEIDKHPPGGIGHR